MKYKISPLFLAVLMLISSGCHQQAAQVPTQAQPVRVEVTEITESTQTTAAAQQIPVQTLPEPEEAEPISEGVCFFRRTEDVSWNLSDGSYLTKVDIPAGESLRIESEQPFAGLYVQWETVPGECSITWEGGSRGCSDKGFLHEYIQLEKEVTGAELWPSENSSVCGIQLFTRGEAPEGVQDWLASCEQADILVFPTHSDDDVLFFGALIAQYAIEGGLTVQTAFMTDHWYEPIRNHERLDGLWAMGVRHYPVLGTAKDYNAPSLNQAISYHREDDILLWQVQLLRRFRPLVAVGHDLNGEYGHSQHKLNAYYLTQAVEAAADEAQYPVSAKEYGTWDTPKLYLHLYPENSIVMDVNTPLKRDPQGRTAFEIAQDAYLCHESQQQYYFQVLQGDVHPTADCRKFGLYRSLVGKDTGWDLMENTEHIR